MTALYTRYRSQRFDDLVGQDAAVRTLKNALAGGRVAHAYLFTGIRGTGKTSTARILAKAVNCLAPVDGEPDNTCVNCVAITEGAATDLIEIDAASNRGVDEIRDLREKARYLPALLKRKVYIIDEAHQLTNEAFNALLKTLEEPPEHVLFVLCTTEAHKLPATIISRCQRFDFRRISEEEIAARLGWIAEKEHLEVRPDGLALLATMAQGSMRDAITMLDQMASAGVEAIDAGTVRRQLGLVTQGELARLLSAAAAGDAGTVLRDLDRVAAAGADMRQLAWSLAEMARKAVLLSISAAAAPALGLESDAAEALQEAVAAGGREFAARAFELAVGAGAEMRQTHEPRLLLELTLLKLATQAPGRASSPAPSPPPAPPRATGSSGNGAGGVALPVAPEVPAAAAPPPASPSPPASGPSGPEAVVPVPEELAAVRLRWQGLLDALKGSAAAIRVGALLKDASPLAVEGDLLTLGFRFAMHSEKAQEPLHRAELEKAVSAVYGRPFRLAFKVDPAVQPVRAEAVPAAGAQAPAVPYAPPGTAAGAATPAGSDETAHPPGPAPGQADGHEALSGEKLVDAAQEILGARVVDIRSRPPQAG